MRAVRAMRRFAPSLLCAGLLAILPGASAQAATFFFTSGSATISATFGAFTIGAGTIPLTGTLVQFDTGPASLATFDLDAAGPNVLPLTGILTGTNITLSNVQVAPGIGYTNFSVTGGPSIFNYTVGPVAVTGTASLAGVINSAPAPFSFTNPALSGQVQLGGGGTLGLNGITLGVINVPASGPFPGGNVTIKADVLFTGIVPEPGTVLLLGGGLVAMGAVGRRSRRE